MERPEERIFTGNPVATVQADRGRYVAAALTIARAYAAASRPNPAPRLASFEAWSDTIRSALIWLGCADPVETSTAQVRPRQASQKYSKELKLIAKRASCGATLIRIKVPMMPPMAAMIRLAPSALNTTLQKRV